MEKQQQQEAHVAARWQNIRPTEWLVLIIEDETDEVVSWLGPYTTWNATKAYDAVWDRINVDRFSAECVAVLVHQERA